MKMLARAALVLSATLAIAPLAAQVVTLPQVRNAASQYVPSQAVVCIDVTGAATGCSGNASVPLATTSASSSVIRAGAGALLGFTGYSSVSGYWLIFDAAAEPANGAVTPLDCFPYTGGEKFAVDYRVSPISVTTGLTVAFSTTGCFTKTGSATAYISAKVR